jgi:hypothetical protein
MHATAAALRIARSLGAAVLVCAAAAPAWADGDVAVSLEKRGKLVVTGDAAANSFEIERMSEPRAFRVVGLSDTTVNGAPEFEVQGVLRIRIEAGDGDDVVVLDALRLRRSLTVDLGDGNDELHMPAIEVFGRTRIAGAEGDDTVTTDFNARFHRRLIVRTHAGNDAIRLRDTVLHGYTRLVAREGDDEVSLDDVTAFEGARVDVFTGLGEDVVNVENSAIDANMRVATSSDDDRITVLQTAFSEDVILHAGGQDDDVKVEGCQFRKHLRAAGGSGTDRVEARANFFFVLIRTGGSGSDKFFWAFATMHVF